jgi:hypothetical protein
VVGVPVVEGQVVLYQGSEDWNLVLSIVIDDLLGELGLIDIVTVAAQLLVDEALLVGSEFSRGNVRITRRKSAIKLDVVSGN